MNSPTQKGFSTIGLLSALASTVILALTVPSLFGIWTDGLENLPGLPLTALLIAPAIASYFSWSYYFTGKRTHGWIVATLFFGCGLPLILLAFNASPERHFIPLEVILAAIYTIPLLLSLGLFCELRKT